MGAESKRDLTLRLLAATSMPDGPARDALLDLAERIDAYGGDDQQHMVLVFAHHAGLSQAIEIFAIKSELEEQRDFYRDRREMRDFFGADGRDPGASDDER
ncbi:hypothetical protein ABIB37_000372 [Agrococcus sp. UYP10]|uniref:hypothetical protein n=1 Tax=Agrococcus sp. UYP10 TaxID=1756355 RepID=UPI00339B38C6